MLNVRAASAQQINDNKEITDIKHILGLKHAVDYSAESAFKSLRYGKVCILTDADADGEHIKGLILNFFHFFYPTLLEREYITSMRTPIVKVKMGKQEIPFYYLKHFREWANENEGGRYTVKYYKGLGTNDAKEAVQIFKNPVNVKYVNDETSTEMINIVFHKKRAEDRKKWLQEFKNEEFIYEKIDSTEIVPISDFFNNEMIYFSMYDCERSIPSFVDGLKLCQRKAIWVAFKTNLTSDCKVAQFGSKVAEISEYHHGEVSMCEAIVKMAQTFVGSNNLPLFEECGQFGTRGSGGKDSAATRYIYTRLTAFAKLVYNPNDWELVKEQDGEDGKIEPAFYIPIIPMILVNGGNGIGTAYSANFPNFNPINIIDWIIKWLDGESTDLPELKPWYLGFQGTTVQDEKSKSRFNHYGVVNQIDTNCYEITELPVGMWTDDYQNLLNNLKTGSGSTSSGGGSNATAKKVKTGYEAMGVVQLKAELQNRSLPMTGTKAQLVDKLKKSDRELGTTPKEVALAAGDQLVKDWEWHGDIYNIKFKVWTKPGVTVETSNPKFKLKTTDSTGNMTAFTESGKLHKYKNVNEILHLFCKLRLQFYQERKAWLIKNLNLQLPELQSKAKFIQTVLNDFTILKQTEDELFEYFSENEYWQKNGEYNYLSSMQIRSFTADKFKELKASIEKIKKELLQIKNTEPQEMWKTDLNELATTYKKWCEKITKSRMKK